jgi:hypothetical protein
VRSTTAPPRRDDERRIAREQQDRECRHPPVKLPIMSTDSAPARRSTESLGIPAFADRLSRLATQAAIGGADVVIISPGADLQYFAGHSVS